MNAQDENSIETVTAIILEFARRTLRWPALKAEDELFVSGATSLFAMQLVGYVEDAFQCTIRDEDLVLDNFRSVSAVAALVAQAERREASTNPSSEKHD